MTGGAGFVGRAVVAAFRSAGAEVFVADHDPHPDVSTVVGDLTDPVVREQAMADRPDGQRTGPLAGPSTGPLTGVVHLAAITSVLKSAERPQQTFAANVEVTQGLLELARQRGVPRFVLASTNAVVGDVGRRVITEDQPIRPLTPYGATKAACEMLLSGYAGAYGMATCALRFTNIYGPGMAAKDSFVPRIMRAAAAGRGVQVYGDGSQVRDLVHVDDVVQGVLRAWQHQYAGTAIIGSGRSVSVLELIETARAVTGAALPVEHVPAKTGEMPAVIVDTARARAALGYRPEVALADGLKSVWQDFQPR